MESGMALGVGVGLWAWTHMQPRPEITAGLMQIRYRKFQRANDKWRLI
jgi:hypothetical protein